MKKVCTLAIALLFYQISLAQQDLIEHWTLHYMVIDGITYNVTQPNPGDPSYHPGIEFFNNSNGYQVNGFVHFNYFFDSEPPVIIDTTTFTINSPSVTLGDCAPYCTLEGQYLGTILSAGSGPRTFDYEIIDESNGDKTLIITNPEGNIAVHGNYVLAVDSFEKTDIILYPNPVDNTLNIGSSKVIIPKKVRILSVTGKEILHRTTELHILDLSLLKPGMYFLELTTSEDKKHVQKFIKK